MRKLAIACPISAASLLIALPAANASKLYIREYKDIAAIEIIYVSAGGTFTATYAK